MYNKLKQPPYQNWFWRRRGLAGGGVGFTPTSPLDAPDEDFLHWFDFSDNSRLVKVGAPAINITKAYFGKLVDDPIGTFYSEQLSSSPKDTGVINSLQAANFEGNIRQLEENPTVPAGYNFMYTDYTFFVVVRPTDPTQIGDVFSDYGVSSLILLRVGNGDEIDGNNLQVNAFMRGAVENIDVTTGTDYLSINTDYLIVAKYDGTNKTISLWIDGGTAYTDTNALYVSSTTFEGGIGDGRMGQLSQYVAINPFQGYIGSAFVTKTALSNTDINAYASWMAEKWGTTWTPIV
jgi:hypothetical protein